MYGLTRKDWVRIGVIAFVALPCIWLFVVLMAGIGS